MGKILDTMTQMNVDVVVKVLRLFPEGLSVLTLRNVIAEGYILENSHVSRAIRLALEKGDIVLGDNLFLKLKDDDAK